MLLTYTVFSQAISVNPDDPFYQDATAWEMNGYVDKLPRLRPFPVNLVEQILLQAMDCGNPKVEEKAKFYYEQNFTKPWTVSVGAGGSYEYSRQEYTHYTDDSKNGKEYDDHKHAFFDPRIAGSLELTPLIGYAYDVGFYAKKNDELLPYYQNSSYDSVFDASEVGPIDLYLDANMGLSLGRENFYAMAGITRSGYGPFLNSGFALNDTAYHAANFSVTFMRPRWNYSQQLSSLGATNMKGDIDNLSYNKFLAFHAFELRLLPSLSVSYYETVVFGRRFEFSYLTPVMYMTAQNISGANDNLQMGLLIEWSPFGNVKWVNDIFVDDYAVDDFVKLHVDAKYRFGWKTGFIIAPKISSCTYMSCDYTIQTPYLYAHWDYDNPNSDPTLFDSHTINYQNYTNAGMPMGSSLPPNSDKISFFATFRPFKRLTLNIMTNFMRHANVCESYDEEDAWYMLTHDDIRSDGSLYTTQVKNPGGDHIGAAWDHLSLLTQSNSMKIYQAGISGEYKFSKKANKGWSIKAGYVFEYVVNAGVDEPLFKYDRNLAEYGLEKDATTGEYIKDEYGLYKEKEYDEDDSTMKNAVKKALKDWREALHNDINHYLQLSLKYSF